MTTPGAVGVPTPAALLLAGASPVDKARLAIDAEFDLVEAHVRDGLHGDQLEVVLSHNTALAEFARHLLDDQPSVVHFTGHGSQRDELYFENDDGLSVVVSVEQLRSLFGNFRGVVRCVVLNACYSAPQAEVISEFADCVIGMSDRVTDAASHSFSDGFYRALTSGNDVATAFDLAVVNIDLAGIPEAATPALFGRERAAMLVFDGTCVSDAEIATTVEEGAEAVVRSLYESKYLPLVRLASTLIDSVSVCEGVVQEAFVDVLTGAAGQAPSEAEALAALRDSVIRLANERRSAAATLIPEQQPPTLGDTTAGADDDVTRVLRALHTLARHEQAAVLLTEVAGDERAAIAERMGMSEAAVTELASKALPRVAELAGVAP